MADDRLRELERAAVQGDQDAEARYARERCRAGEHCACRKPIPALVLMTHSVDFDSVFLEGLEEEHIRRAMRGPCTTKFYLTMRAGSGPGLHEAIQEVYERLGVVFK